MTFRRRVPAELVASGARRIRALVGLGVGGVGVRAANLSHDLRPPARGALAAGILAAGPIEVFGPSLTVGRSSGGSFGLLGPGPSRRKAARTVSPQAPARVGVLAIGFGLALPGSLIAGTSDASRLAVVPGRRGRPGRTSAVGLRHAPDLLCAARGRPSRLPGMHGARCGSRARTPSSRQPAWGVPTCVGGCSSRSTRWGSSRKPNTCRRTGRAAHGGVSPAAFAAAPSIV